MVPRGALGVRVPRAALGVRVPRAALGVRVPRAQVRRVATLSELKNLNQEVRVPWTDRITRRLVYIINESMGMNVRPLEALQPQTIIFIISIIFYIKSATVKGICPRATE